MSAPFDYNDVENFLPPSAELLQSAPLGHWVAVSQDRQRILATGEDLKQVADEAKALGEDDPIFAKNPPAWGYRVF